MADGDIKYGVLYDKFREKLAEREPDLLVADAYGNIQTDPTTRLGDLIAESLHELDERVEAMYETHTDENGRIRLITTANTDTVNTSSPDRCKSRGHTLNTDIVTYRDGLIAGHCALCDERFEIPWWPGGTAAARAEGVVIDVLEQREGVDYAQELLVSAEQIDADIEALEDAREKIVLARQTLAQRLVDGD